MGNGIINKSATDFQLVSIGIELVNKIFGLMDCNPDLIANPHVAKAHDLAKQWNTAFVKGYVSPSKDGGI